jgi:hypothetical protein
MNHVCVRMNPDDITLLKNVCSNRGEQVSDFVRRAVLKELAQLSYFEPDRKKSLGIKADGKPRV